MTKEKFLSLLSLGVLAILWHSLVVCWLWYILIVPIFNVKPLLLREAFAISIFLNFFIVVHNIEREDKNPYMRRLLAILLVSVVMVCFAMFYSWLLL